MLLSPGREASMGEAGYSLGSRQSGSQGPDRVLEIGDQRSCGTWVLEVPDQETGLWPGELSRWRQITEDCVWTVKEDMEMEGGPLCHPFGKGSSQNPPKN